MWKAHPDPDYVDAIYLSHRPADHYFGLPSVLLRFAEDERSKPLTILCPDGMKSVIIEMIDYGYLGALPKMNYEIKFKEVTEGKILFNDAELSFAASSHPVKNYAIAVMENGRKYAYSGDGNFNARTRELYRDCSLLVHESYAFGFDAHGHAEITAVIAMASEQNVKLLALTHIQRDVRKNRMLEIQEMIRKSDLDVIIPEPGDVLDV